MNISYNAHERNELYKKKFLECPDLVKDAIFIVRPLLMHKQFTEHFGNCSDYILSDKDRTTLLDNFYQDLKNCNDGLVFYYLYIAAEQLNYSYLCDILSNNLTEIKRFGLDYFAACLEIISLSENMKPINRDIIERCWEKKLFNQSEKDKLLQELDREGPTNAFYYLVELLKRRHSEWYILFIEVLAETKNKDAIRIMDEDLLKRLDKVGYLEEETDTDNLRNEIKAYFRELYREQFGENDSFEEEEQTIPQPITTDCLERPLLQVDCPENLGAYGGPTIIPKKTADSPALKLESTTANKDDEFKFSWNDFLIDDAMHNVEKKVENVPFTLRDYQHELAHRAIQGDNVIICAPTGSGKTHVAAKIAQEHLTGRLEDRKVAFLVHRVNLVDQQHSLFEQLLSRFNIRVNKFSGGSGVSDGASVPIKYAMRDCHMLVLTADILLNALNTDDELTKIESLEELSLIIFDECHNCTKGHSYNRIMVQYFNDKENFLKVPQIVGLTASPGTNKANNMKTAFDHLVTLCANMDASYIQTVEEDQNIKNLKEHNKNPHDKVTCSTAKSPNICEDLLNKMMRICENALVKLHCEKHIFDPRYDVSNSIRAPENRGHSIYTNFVGRLATLHTMTLQDPPVYRNSVYCIYKYLNIYDRAFKLNRLFRDKDTAKFIREELDVDCPKFQPTCSLDEHLMDILKNSEFVKGFSVDVKNPALEDLKREILNQLKEFPDSRIIVFVKQRVFTQLMKDYFSSDEELRGIPSDLIVGANAGQDDGGATKVWQREVLSKFKDGTNKVLFSTTVAEEGLDVVKCNLVIRYGHITNETAMIQSKGRARAELSKYVVVVPFGEDWQRRKEQVNIYREDLMKQAIKKFINMNEEERRDAIKSAQMVADCERKLEVVSRKKKEFNNDGCEYHLHCIRCNQFFCKSTDFRLAQGVHRFMNETNYYNKFKIVESRTPPRPVGQSREFLVGDKITCAKCGQDFGMIAIFKSMAYPVISIANFSLKDEEGIVRTVKRWKDAPFNVQTLTTQEIHERSVNFGNKWTIPDYYEDFLQ